MTCQDGVEGRHIAKIAPVDPTQRGGARGSSAAGTAGGGRSQRAVGGVGKRRSGTSRSAVATRRSKKNDFSNHTMAVLTFSLPSAMLGVNKLLLTEPELLHTQARDEIPRACRAALSLVDASSQQDKHKHSMEFKTKVQHQDQAHNGLRWHCCKHQSLPPPPSSSSPPPISSLNPPSLPRPLYVILGENVALNEDVRRGWPGRPPRWQLDQHPRVQVAMRAGLETPVPRVSNMRMTLDEAVEALRFSMAPVGSEPMAPMGSAAGSEAARELSSSMQPLLAELMRLAKPPEVRPLAWEDGTPQALAAAFTGNLTLSALTNSPPNVGRVHGLPSAFAKSFLAAVGLTPKSLAVRGSVVPDDANVLAFDDPRVFLSLRHDQPCYTSAHLNLLCCSRKASAQYSKGWCLRKRI